MATSLPLGGGFATRTNRKGEFLAGRASGTIENAFAELFDAEPLEALANDGSVPFLDLAEVGTPDQGPFSD